MWLKSLDSSQERSEFARIARESSCRRAEVSNYNWATRIQNYNNKYANKSSVMIVGELDVCAQLRTSSLRTTKDFQFQMVNQGLSSTGLARTRTRTEPSRTRTRTRT